MTSNFCKTSWHPYGHTPEECPDCRLCHESKIPKKLEFRPHLTTGVIARDRDMEMLVLWLNELRDYLQAKEEASKREFNRGFDEGEKFGRISERMYPESKGGCKQCMSQCRECVECRKNPNPPEHEEDFDRLAQGLRNHVIDDVRFSGLFEYVKDYIRDNFEPKRKKHE